MRLTCDWIIVHDLKMAECAKTKSKLVDAASCGKKINSDVWECVAYFLLFWLQHLELTVDCDLIVKNFF